MPPPAFPETRWEDFRSAGGQGAWRNLVDDRYVSYTYSGRGAIYQYLITLQEEPNFRRSVVLVPAFHCPTVIVPVLHAGFDIRFYEISENLRVQQSDLLSKLDQNVAVVVFIDFFGLSEADQSLRDAVKRAGARILDDCSHSFLKANPLRAAWGDGDASIYSFWKLLPSVTGGGLHWHNKHRPRLQKPPLRSTIPIYRVMMRSILQREIAAVRGIWRSKADATATSLQPVAIRSANEAYPYEEQSSTWSIPEFSRRILLNADLDSIVRCRRANYELISQKVKFTDDFSAVVPELPRSACPWGLPVVLRNRSTRDYRLRATGVPVFSFGEVLHPLLEKQSSHTRMFDLALFLSNSVLVLAIHQGFSVEENAGHAQLINQFLEGD